MGAMNKRDADHWLGMLAADVWWQRRMAYSAQRNPLAWIGAQDDTFALQSSGVYWWEFCR